MSIADLWGFSEDPIEEFRTPAAILKEQAELFSNSMREKGVYAELIQRNVSDQKRLAFGLDIVAPGLDDYRVRVVSISFAVTASYPVRVVSDFSGPQILGSDMNDELEFIESLKNIFQSSPMRVAISSLISNSNL